MLDQVNTGRIVGQQRAERVHHQVEDFIKIERTADLLRDVEQHAQLFDGTKPLTCVRSLIVVH